METDEFLRRVDEIRQRESARADGNSSNPYRLLPGEDPATPYPEDAPHWVAVYDELVHFKQELVAQLKAKQDEVTPPAAAELHKDEVDLRAELERLQLHLRYWQERHQRSPTGSNPG